jgi:beta-barrel assembly-enhancing protease
LGRHYGQQVEATIKLIQDPVITEYVNRVGQNIGRNSDAQVPFTIKVIDSDEINAFALPGGYYVNSGLILAADEEAELGDVMAHEISHVAACHAARENTRGNLLSLASIPLILVGGPIGYAGCQAAGLALPVTFLHSSRAFEAEADYLGLQYVCKSGYDPNAFISFFEKVQAEEKKKPGALAKAFSTHPQNTGSHRKVAAGDRTNLAHSNRICRIDLRIRRRQRTARGAGESAQGGRPGGAQGTYPAACLLGRRQEQPRQQE